MQRRTSADGQLYNFQLSGFVRSAPRDSVAYVEMLSETQAFSEFIMERCDKPADDPEIAYFDQMIVAKRNRGRHGLFAKQGLPASHLQRHFTGVLLTVKGTPMLSSVPIALETHTAIPPNETRLPPSWELPDTPPSKIDAKTLLPPRLAQHRNKFSREKGFAKRKPVKGSVDTIVFSPHQED